MKNETLYAMERVREILSQSSHAVFFGGAGVSTDSGIPDFRGNGGMYQKAEEANEYYLSRECLVREPERFFDFFRRNMTFEGFLPNDTHFALADMEKQGIIRAVITQNIDGLHQKAGSECVIELHGTAGRFYCMRCGKVFSSDVLRDDDGVPHCAVCGGVIRPDVTLYGEALDGFSFAEAEAEIAKADVLIAGGSSLVVNPAASLVGNFSGEHLIIVNLSPTPYDGLAEYVIRDSLSDVFRYLQEKL